VGFSKRFLETALKAVAVETPRAAEIVRQEAPSARRRMIARASAIFRDRAAFPLLSRYAAPLEHAPQSNSARLTPVVQRL